MNTISRYRVWHFRFWGAFWIHMRPYLLFLSGVAGFAGMCATGSIIDQPTLLIIIGFLSFFFAYGFGQALTDCFQVDTDSISAPYRPLSQGVVSPMSIGIVALIGLISVSTTLIVLSPGNIILCTVSIIGLSTYTFFKRRFWWAGPPYNSIIMACLPIMGYNLFVDPDFRLTVDTWLIVSLTFLSYLNFVLIGYLKDISADRQTGYKTFPVVFGWDNTAALGDIIALASAGLAFWICRNSTEALILVAIGTTIALIGQFQLHTVKQQVESNSASAIVATVRSFVLWHLGVAVNYAPKLTIYAVAFYAVFEIVLKSRPLRHQI